MSVQVSYGLRFLIVAGVGIVAVLVSSAALSYGRLIRKRCVRVLRGRRLR